MDWQKITQDSPPERKTVITIIWDENGQRNEQRLYRQGRLWFSPDGSGYVYYTPTHWKP